MSDATLAVGAVAVDSARLAVASQWQLVWWAFQPPPAGDDRPRGSPIVLYIIAVVPGFFAVNDPSQQNAPRGVTTRRRPSTSSTREPDGSWSLRPYIHPYTAEARPADAGRDLRRRQRPQDLPDRSSAEGYEYSVLGLFTTKHAPASPPTSRASRCSSSAPTGSAAASTAASCRARRSRSRVGLVGVLLSLIIGVAARRHLGLLRRPDRLRDPARDRVRAVAADDPDLARAGGGAAAGLAGRPLNIS